MDNQTTNDYNSIPVLYCKNCLSLRIMGIEGFEDADFCDECGSTDIVKSSIEEWQELYRAKSGHDFLTE